MILSLLNSTTGTGGEGGNSSSTIMFIVIIAVIVIFVAFMLLSGRKNKARQQEYVEQLEAIRPGHKVKTAGGICGIVVEVCDDNTVIIETGSENSGKSYIKMDKELIAQTDAKGPTQIAREEAEAKRKAEKEAKAAAKGKKKGEAPAEEPSEASAQPAGKDEANEPGEKKEN